MAWSLVGQVAFQASDATDTTQSLPGTPQEGDIVLIGASCDAAITSAFISTSGYTSFETHDTGANPGNAFYWKIMGATPDTDITIAAAASTEFMACVLQVWRGVDTTTPNDVTPTVASSGAGMPDPPSITPTTNGCLIVAFGALDDDNVASEVGAPSGYSNLLASDNSSNADNATSMIASMEQATAAAENPGAFTSTTGTDAWRATTVALRPAAGGGPTVNSSKLALVGVGV